MTTATLELYNALIEAGVTKEKAEAAAKAVITRHEAEETLATKEDIASIYRDMMAGKFLARSGVLTEFFDRTEPASINKKPACIKKTSKVAITIQLSFV